MEQLKYPLPFTRIESGAGYLNGHAVQSTGLSSLAGKEWKRTAYLESEMLSIFVPIKYRLGLPMVPVPNEKNLLCIIVLCQPFMSSSCPYWVVHNNPTIQSISEMYAGVSMVPNRVRGDTSKDDHFSREKSSPKGS